MHTDDDTIRCRRCRRPRTAEEVDRMIWCEDCQIAERRRARGRGRLLALAATAILGVWIALTMRPSREFLPLWAVVLVVAYFLGARIGTELTYGAIRIRNTPGARVGAADAAGGEAGTDADADADAAADADPPQRASRPPRRGPGGGT